jgi:hypothetical protein
MNKYLSVLVMTTFVTVGCNSKYDKGFDAGYGEGFGEGYAQTYDQAFSSGATSGSTDGGADGFDVGFEVGADIGFGQAYDDFATAEYVSGFNSGDAAGYQQGYSDQYTVGSSQGAIAGDNDGYSDGYNSGLNLGDADGYTDGYNDYYSGGYNDGYADGDADGYSNGYADGEVVGFDEGYDDGYSDSYSVGDAAGYSDGYDSAYNDGYNDNYGSGYDDGYSAGLGSSLKSKNPSVKLAAMVNSDLIDYSKLEKFNSKSLVESGSVVFSHADSGSVDMEKLSALKEQHYLNQMSRQLQANYSLDQKSANRIAKVANQFNKISGSKNMSEKDAEVFSKELIGFDLALVRGAVKDSMKGNSTKLNDLMDKASKTMGTSPEQLNKMISKIFN